MPALPLDDSHPWVKQIQDALADSSGVREGLSDEDAIPLVEWGAARARDVAGRLAAPETPEPTPEQVEEKGYALVRLVTRLNWVVTYRTKKDAAWLTRTFQMINKLSQDLYGEGAPVLADQEVAAWLADHPNHATGELIRDLMTRYTPPSAADAAADAPGVGAILGADLTPDAPPPDAPQPPGGASPIPPFGGAILPRRSGDEPPSNSDYQTGESHEQR